MPSFWNKSKAKPKVKVTKHGTVPLRQPEEDEKRYRSLSADNNSGGAASHKPEEERKRVTNKQSNVHVVVHDKKPLNPPQPTQTSDKPPSVPVPSEEKPSGLKPPPDRSPPPLKVFLSYAHKDKKYIEDLRTAVKLMERQNLIKIWYDRELTAGEEWAERIREELSQADIIICQLSRDFLGSDYCVLTELDTALRRKLAGEAELVAYVLKACEWEQEKVLSKFQILPEGAKPLRGWSDRDEYWKAVAKGIRQAVTKLRQERTGTGRQAS